MLGIVKFAWNFLNSKFVLKVRDIWALFFCSKLEEADVKQLIDRQSKWWEYNLKPVLLQPSFWKTRAFFCQWIKNTEDICEV